MNAHRSYASMDDFSGRLSRRLDDAPARIWAWRKNWINWHSDRFRQFYGRLFEAVSRMDWEPPVSYWADPDDFNPTPPMTWGMDHYGQPSPPDEAKS